MSEEIQTTSDVINVSIPDATVVSEDAQDTVVSKPTITVNAHRKEMNTVVKLKGQFNYNTPITHIYFPNNIIFSDIVIGNIKDWTSIADATLHFDLYVNDVAAVKDIIPPYTITGTDITKPVSIMPMPLSTKTYLGSNTLSEIVKSIYDGTFTVTDKTALSKMSKNDISWGLFSIVPIIKEKPSTVPAGTGTTTTTPSTDLVGLKTSYIQLLFEYM